MIRHEVYQDDPAIIIEYFPKNWTWEAYLEARIQLRQLVAHFKSPVSAVMYFENGVSLPSNIFMKMKKIQPVSEIVRGIIVPDDTALRFVVGVLQRLNHPVAHKLEFAATLDEALKRLQTHRDNGNSHSSFHVNR